VALDRAIDRIDHVERTPGGAAVLHVPGLYVEREELGSLPSLLHPRDAGAIRSRRRAAEIVIVVGHRRGDVIMGVDDYGASMNRQGPLPKRFITRRTRRCFPLRWPSRALRAGGNREREAGKNKKRSQR
jgi:hypothetical protein